METGTRSVTWAPLRPGFVLGILLSHWPANERDPFVPRLIGDARRNFFTFVHALNVFVSFTPLLSLYKKEYKKLYNKLLTVANLHFKSEKLSCAY
jgi:hypothetical protein